MKKLGVVLLVLLFGLNTALFANDNVEKFVGKWNLLVKDLPDGDTEMTLLVELKDGKLGGKLVGKDKEEFPIYDVEVNGKELLFMYDARGYNVTMALELIGEGKCEGYMMDMFLVEGEKAKDESKE